MLWPSRMVMSHSMHNLKVFQIKIGFLVKTEELQLNFWKKTNKKQNNSFFSIKVCMYPNTDIFQFLFWMPWSADNIGWPIILHFSKMVATLTTVCDTSRLVMTNPSSHIILWPLLLCPLLIYNSYSPDSLLFIILLFLTPHSRLFHLFLSRRVSIQLVTISTLLTHYVLWVCNTFLLLVEQILLCIAKETDLFEIIKTEISWKICSLFFLSWHTECV